MGLGHWVAVGSLLACSACTVFIDAEPQQCQADTDCTARGGEFKRTECDEGYCSPAEPEVVQTIAPAEPDDSCTKETDCDLSESCVEKECVSRWACVSEEPVAPSTEAIEVSVLVATSFGEAMPGVPGKACRSIDPSCGSPVLEATTDASGLFHLTLPAGFTGYLEVVYEPFFPVLYYFPAPLQAGTMLPVLNLTPAELIAGLGLAVGAAPDPERGHVLLSLKSCLGAAPGVHLSAPKADDKTITYYVQGGIPSADRDATTEDGSGGFLNFLPGNAAIELSAGAIESLGSLSLTVRPGYITAVSFDPNL